MRYHAAVHATSWMVMGLIAPLFFAACGDDESGNGGSAGSPMGGGDQTGGGGSGGDPNCPESGTCAVEDCPTDDSGCTWSCMLASSCDEVVFTGMGDTLAFPFTLADATAADCVLGALRAGTEGTYRWRVEDATGMNSQSRELHVRADRRALYRGQANDSGGPRSDKRGPAMMQDAAFFTGCQAESNPNDIWGCLEDWEFMCQ